MYRPLIYRITSYFKVGFLLHFIALCDLILAALIFSKLNGKSIAEMSFAEILMFFLGVFFVSNFVFAELDVWSRYQNYKQLRDQIIKFGFRFILLKPLMPSKCQRDAAILACKHTGYSKRCRVFIFQNGYKWYNIIPDFVFKYPLFFFNSYFWRTTFFTPYYMAEYVYIGKNLNVPKKYA